MVRRTVLGVLVVALVGGGMLATPLRGGAEGGGFLYASLADEAAIYLNDMVFVRDTVSLPAGDVRVLLPPGVYPNTLMLTENGARVRTYRLMPQAADVYYNQAAFRYGTASYGVGGTAYALTWESTAGAEAAREVKLEYLMSGARWTPSYDMEIVSDNEVALAFFAEVQSMGLVLRDATVYLLAGRVDLSRQMEQVSQVTMNQYAVGYANEMVMLPALDVGAVELQHVYGLGTVSAEPGELLYVSVAEAALAARRLHVWNAAESQEVDVIYKVANNTEVPFAEGIVRTFQDGLFMGSDFIETTPVGSEGSVTVGRLPDLRVRRSASQEYQTEDGRAYYQHTVVLEVRNYGEQPLDLIVLDRWEESARQFEFSQTPERQQDNLLRWELSLPAGESVTITYTYRTDY